MKKNMKIFVCVFLLALAVTGVAVAAQGYYYRCSKCDAVIIRDGEPSRGICPAGIKGSPSNNSGGHNWVQDGRVPD